MSELRAFLNNTDNRNNKYTPKELRELASAKIKKQIQEKQEKEEKEKQINIEKRLLQHKKIIKELSLKELVGTVKRDYQVHDSDTDSYDRYTCLPYVRTYLMSYGELKEKISEVHKSIDGCNTTEISILADLLEFIDETEKVKKHSDNEACFISHTSGLPFGFLRKNKKYIIRFLNEETTNGYIEYDYLRACCSIASIYDRTYISLFSNY